MRAKNMLDKSLPIEDTAISNLLEIDQRDNDVNIWEDAHISLQLPVKRRTFSFHKFHDAKNSNPSHNHPSVEQIHATHRSSNPESDKKMEEPVFLQRKQIIYPFQDELEKQRENYEAEYWPARTNWVDGKEDHGIHSKNVKKQSALCDNADNRKGRSLHKLEKQDKCHNNDSETNQFSHLLNQNDYKSQRGTMRYSFNVEHKIYDINGRKIGRSVDHKDRKKANRIDAILQLNMRQTLRRLYNKHHRQEHIQLPFNYKPAEHQRSTMVRQLLINLQNMKDCQSFSQDLGRQEKKEIRMKEAVPLESEERGDLKKIRNIVDLNAEAEKVHKNMGVNRWSGKKPIPLAKLP